MKINVKHVAKLANLPLSQNEEEKYAKQLSKILDYMEKLNQADTLGVEPTFNVSGLSNVTTNKKGHYVTKGVFNE